MTIKTIAWGNRKTRKPHYCYDCYCVIPSGQQVAFFTGVMDGHAYTLYFHEDCRQSADEWRKWLGFSFYDYEEGYPPLADEVRDSEFDINISWLRGRFPHVACRLEYAEQKAEIRLGQWRGL